jgi:hypothetical protein
VPYADVERRRQFHREYKRRMRQAQGKQSPLREFKIFVCTRFPTLSVGGTTFYNGFLITDDPTVQDQVRRHQLFGRAIFPLALDLSVTPIKED